MADGPTVLIVGSSLVCFTQDGDAMRLPALVSRRLAMLTPDTTWRCEAEVLYMTDSAHARMSTLLDEIAPDVVVFELATYQFIHRAAVLTVRRRWRRLYRAASLVVGLVSRAGGGALGGAPGVRGAVFRVPRDLARRVLGSETEIDVEQSLAFVRSILDELRSRRLPLVYSTSPFFWDEPDPAEGREKLRYAARVMADYCVLHAIPTYDLEASLEAAGRRLGLAPDGLHYDLPTREFQAELVAAAVLEAIAGARS